MVNFSKILVDAKNKILSNTDIKTFDSGSIIKYLIEVYKDEATSTYNTLSNKIVQGFISDAEGLYLDEMGKLVGVIRSQNQRAYGEVKFYIDPSFDYDIDDIKTILIDAGIISLGEDIVFSSGIEVTNENGDITYTTTEDIIFDDNIVIPVLASGSGSTYNVGSGGLTSFKFSDPAYEIIEDYIQVINDQAIENGESVESDDNYRYRIIHSFEDKAKANEMAIRLAALSVPGVSDVYINEYEYGIGTFTVYVISESPIVSTGVITAVQEAVNQTKATGNRGIVTSPEYEAIHMEIYLHFIDGTSTSTKNVITNQVNSAVVDYINNLPLGAELILNKITDVIMDISDSIKNFEITQFGRGDYNITDGVIDNYETLLIKDQLIDYDTKYCTNKKLIVCCYQNS